MAAEKSKLRVATIKSKMPARCVMPQAILVGGVDASNLGGLILVEFKPTANAVKAANECGNSEDEYGLTDSSSATEAGQVKRAARERLDGQSLFAGARG